MNCVRISFLGALFGVLPLSAAVLAEPDAPFATLLPAETIAYVETSAPTAAELARAVQYHCLQDPGLNRMLDRMLAEKSNFTQMAIPVGNGVLHASMNIREPGLSFDLRFQRGKSVHKMNVRGNLAFAWVGTSAADSQAGRQRAGRRAATVPDLVAAFTIEGDPADAHRLVRAVLDSVAGTRGASSGRDAASRNRSADNRFAVMDWKHRDVACTSCRIDGTRVHFGVVGKRLVLTSTRKRLVDIIDRSHLPAAKAIRTSLAGVQRHRDVRASVHGSMSSPGGGAAGGRESAKGTITSLIDIDSRLLLKTLAQSNAGRFGALQGVAETIGLGGLDGFSSVTRVDGDGVAGTTSILLSGRRTGLARFFAEQPPAKFGALAFAPKESLYVGCGHFDGKTAFRALAEASQPLLMRFLMEVHRDTGLNLRDDVMHLIGPEVALIVASNHGLWPDVGVIVESSDAKRLEASILKLFQTRDLTRVVTVERARIAGGDVSILKFKDGNVPVAPTLGVVDGHLVLALFPITYQRLVATKRGERDGLNKNLDYVALSKRIPKDAIGMSYLDVRRTIQIVYDTVVPMVQAMPHVPGQPSAPVYELPEASVFADHLYGNIGWRTADERGMHWHSKSSTDIGSVGLVMGVAAVGALFVSYEEAERPGVVQIVQIKHDPNDHVREMHMCITNVRRIRNQLRQYRRRSQPFPEKLAGLEGSWVSAEMLVVPGTNNLSYRYFGPKGKNGVLLAGHPNGLNQEICVLMTDLTMKRVRPAELQKTLQEKPQK